MVWYVPCQMQRPLYPYDPIDVVEELSQAET